MMLRTWFENISYRRKLLLMNVILILAAVVIAVIFYLQGISANMNATIRYIREAGYRLNDFVDLGLETEARPNLIPYADGDVELILRKNTAEMSASERYNADRKMTTYLKLITMSRHNTIRATIVTKEGDIYKSDSSELGDYETEIRNWSASLGWNRQIHPWYSETHAVSFGNTSKIVITEACQIYTIGKAEGYAWMFLDINFEEFVKMLNGAFSAVGTDTNVALISQGESIYVSKDADIDLETDLTETEKQELSEVLEKSLETAQIGKGGRTLLLSIIQNEATGWKIVQYTKKSSLIANGIRSMMETLAGLAVLLLVVAMLSFWLADYVSRPIIKLSGLMSKARSGEVERMEDPAVLRRDETGRLILSYNEMADRINDFINRIYVYELNQRQTEIKMLQFQINPHFLYNALHTISSIAKLEDVAYISEIAEALSDMFRYNIKKSDFVTLEDELKQAQNYLRIQEIRFHEQIEVQYEIPEELRQVMLLKFIIQPIMENAFQHAFSNRKKGNVLIIRAFLTNGRDLLIEIEDNGCGMSEDAVEALNAELDNTKTNTLIHDDEKGIGLMNVNARLKNYYGREYGIRIRSEEGCYTCVMLRLLLCLSD